MSVDDASAEECRADEVVARAAAGDSDAFATLYNTWVGRVHRIIFHMLGPDRDLDDLIQTTFVQVFTQLRRFRGEAAFGTWLYRIASNVALEHVRRRSRWRRLLERKPWAGDVEVAEPALGSDASNAIQAVLARLSPEKRVVLVLYEVSGHTLAEMAEILELPLNTVATRLRLARQDARRAMRKLGLLEAASLPTAARPKGVRS